MSSHDRYARRRRELMDLMGPDGVAVVVANPTAMRSHDTDYRYRASSDVIYLSGFAEPDAVMILAPGHDEGEFVLFVRPRDPEREQWDGRRVGVQGALDGFGADVAFRIDELDAKLPQYLEHREVLYISVGQHPSFDARVHGWLGDLRHRRHQPPGAPAKIGDLRDLLHELRLFKGDEELALMREAVRITAEAHELAMRYCHPGMREYELQALIEYHFLRSGASAPAYNSIVGAGPNATILHYIDNASVIGEDDVVLIDAGCEYQHYAADLTRSFPASGTFSGAQRDLYEAVLEVQLADIASVRPGLTFQELKDNSTRRLIEACIQLGLLSGSVDAIVEEQSHKRLIPHGVGHWLGIDVHDVGSYYTAQGHSRGLEPGMVLTIEPGIYILDDDSQAPEAFRGLGVRIEDDILVTADGSENLSAACPKHPDAIEALVGSGERARLAI